MIIKKIFYQVAKDSDWEVGLVFENCNGIVKDAIIDNDGNVLDRNSYNTREPISEHIKIEI